MNLTKLENFQIRFNLSGSTRSEAWLASLILLKLYYMGQWRLHICITLFAVYHVDLPLALYVGMKAWRFITMFLCAYCAYSASIFFCYALSCLPFKLRGISLFFFQPSVYKNQWIPTRFSTFVSDKFHFINSHATQHWKHHLVMS